MRLADFIGQVNRERDALPDHAKRNTNVAICDKDGVFYFQDFEIVWEGEEILLKFDRRTNEL